MARLCSAPAAMAGCGRGAWPTATCCGRRSSRPRTVSALRRFRSEERRVGEGCGSRGSRAEDGIRDGHVTGVQTCALPISVARLGSTRLRHAWLSEATFTPDGKAVLSAGCDGRVRAWGVANGDLLWTKKLQAADGLGLTAL